MWNPIRTKGVLFLFYFIFVVWSKAMEVNGNHAYSKRFAISIYYKIASDIQWIDFSFELTHQGFLFYFFKVTTEALFYKVVLLYG